MLRTAFAATVAIGLLVASADAFGAKTGLKPGTPDLKSAGPLAFGPEGILFIGDPQQSSVFAIDTQEAAGDLADVRINIKAVNDKIASLLGTTAQNILINDLAVNPTNGNVFLSVSRGRGPDAQPVLLRVDAKGKLSDVSLKSVPFAKADLPNPPSATEQDRRGRSLRSQSITDLAFVDGRVIVAGLSNEEFASKLRSIPFPFEKTDAGTSVEIYHGSHGQFETRSPVRAFTPYNINGEPFVLAGYTCTPLVKFPLAQLRPGSKIKGTTIAELGNRNTPLDIVVYKKQGREYLLMANDRRGVMKVSTENIDKIEGIAEPVPDGQTKGLSYETIDELTGVQQLDRLNEENAVILVDAGGGKLDLRTVPLP